MKLSTEVEFKVDFFEVDSMKIVWHGNYINYFERARCALLDKIGYNYIAMEDSGYSYPVVDVRIKYVRSLHFGDTCRAKATLAEYENMIKIQFELYNAKTGKLTTKGSVTQMCIDTRTGETQFVLPKVWTEKVEKLLANGGFQND
ncbi:MAG: acyl-CoA thioesterase [Treponema sp.]|uniref:acyl-CoA thioesterase n=1 Tax=uncultured Treponema sp. TaxID=162155 RepID=UPI0025F45E06|nr:thioesterase family protein [uncultured Treponema sp.]MBR4599649.1 acyl-CoA thioesterase [Treponema sp.]